jgi:hypothetical protein
MAFVHKGFLKFELLTYFENDVFISKFFKGTLLNGCVVQVS